MEHENDFLKILDSVQRVNAPSELYIRILDRLQEPIPYRWRLLAATAAAILILANLSVIALVKEPASHQASKVEMSNPFLDPNEWSYE
jgi:hypothetical protein